MFFVFSGSKDEKEIKKEIPSKAASESFNLLSSAFPHHPIPAYPVIPHPPGSKYPTPQKTESSALHSENAPASKTKEEKQTVGGVGPQEPFPAPHYPRQVFVPPSHPRALKPEQDVKPGSQAFQRLTSPQAYAVRFFICLIRLNH